MRKTLVLWLGFLQALPVFAAGTGAPPQWLVVTAPAFRSDLTPLIEHRRAEGFSVVVIETSDALTTEQLARGDGAALQHRLAQLAPGSATNYLLLAGAFPRAAGTNDPQLVVPTVAGTVGRMKGRPGDYGYCLPDTNGAPTLAVGRFPARNVEELRGMVRKTLELERERGPGAWRNRLLLLAGDTGGGAMADMLIEQVVGPRLEGLHPAWNVRAVFASAASRFFLPADRIQSAAGRELEDGQLFAVFLGHSSAPGMWLAGTNFLSRNDWAGLNISRGRGVFFSCGCYAVQFQGRDGDGYALAALRNPRGPTAVIGACGESYAAPGQLALDGLLQCLKQVPFPSRLADYWRAVQTGLAQGPMDPITFSLYDQIDGSKGRVPLADQRREHLEMWMLLGDPALRLPIVPTDVSLHLAGPARPGRRLAVIGVLPERLAGATVRVTLERPLNSITASLAKLPPESPENHAARERLATENLERANTYLLAAAEAEVAGDAFACPVVVPGELTWSNLVLRATATTPTESAMGIVTLPVER